MNYNEFRERYQWNPKTDKLGEGGFAKVYRATDKIRDRLVVLKIADVPVNHKFSLQREVELNRDLTPHPNIAQYRNCYRLEDAYGDEKDYATMDYFSEGSLNVVMNKYLSPDDIRTIVTGMLRGLAHLESEKVIHRDFKPGNVLMARDADGLWFPKIADFGLSRFTESDITVSNSSVGISYDYAAPEQFQPGSVNRQADLWAFGVIVYRLCTGRSPFISHANLTGESRRIELVQLINQAQLPDDVAEISEPYQTLIRRCVVKELSGRARSANDLLTVLTSKPAPEKKRTVPLESATDESDAGTQVETIVRPREPTNRPQFVVADTPQPDPVNDFVEPLETSSSIEARSSEANPQPTTKRLKYRILALLLLLVGFVAFYGIWRSQASRLAGVQQSALSSVSDTTHTAGLTQPDQISLAQATNDRPKTVLPQPKRLVDESSAFNRADRETPTRTDSKEPLKTSPEHTEPTPGVVATEEKEVVNSTAAFNAALPLKPLAVTADKPDNSGNRPASGSRTLRLSGGATVMVALRESVIAATVKEGQPLSLEVVKPILVDGEVVIPQGADVMGEVANVSTGGKKDMLEIRIHSVRGIGGQVINLRAATFRYVGSRNESLIFKAGQQFMVNTAGAYKFSL